MSKYVVKSGGGTTLKKGAVNFNEIPVKSGIHAAFDCFGSGRNPAAYR